MLKRASTSVGSLYVVGLPIGNHEDITLRALKVLRDVTVIAAEDPLVIRALLDRYAIETPLTSYHRWNCADKIPVLIDRLRQGQSIALAVDAGTPAIVDPGRLLAAQAARAGIPVVPIPGPSAVTAALSVSGFSGDSFSFYGQVPARNFARQRFFEARRRDDRVLVLYAPVRSLRSILVAIRSFLGDRRIVIAQDMTKPSERLLRGRISDLLRRTDWKLPRGEATIVVEGKNRRNDLEGK
ncbi:MAG TPA: ribosomal RNA small subunit methyltransferase I [Nitrospiraceae bacterium]|jgi:16S rRNA (cytidine1402-2'-O)-methyltransferase|nr:ribosomal RNA small subunit methyltransferase I [Nitrospiraceae bacterium]